METAVKESPTKPENLDDLKGKPKKLYKLVKADLLDQEELDRCHELGFPDEEFDAENELHCQMRVAVQEAEKRIIQKQQTEREAARQELIELAKIYLEKEHPQVDASMLPEPVLEEIGRGINKAAVAPPDAEEVIIVQQDEETLALLTESGEVIGFVDAPRNDQEQRLILEWVGEKLEYSAARQAGLQAEKDHWISRINSIYDPQIKKQERIQKQLKFLYEPTGKAYLDELVAKHKGKNPLRSVKVGLLRLQYTKTRERTDVLDMNLAVAWAEENAPNAVKIEKSVLKTGITDEQKKTLTEDLKGKTGLFWYPGGEDKFDLK